MNSLSLHSKLKFHVLRWKQSADDADYDIITRWDTDDSLIANKEDSAIIKHLYNLESLQEVSKKLNVSSTSIIQIIKTLKEVNFVRDIDDIALPDTAQQITPALRSLKSRYLTWLVQPITIWIVVLSILSLVIPFFLLPNRYPSIADIFWDPDIGKVFIINFVITYLFLFLHEFAHFFVTKAIGGESSMRFSYRFIYLVVETRSYHIASKPKRQRYLVYLAGLAVDFLTISGIYWFLYVTGVLGYNLGMYEHILKAIVLFQISGIIWEMNAFLETDIYNVISDFFDQPNLYANMKQLLLNKFLRMTHMAPKILRHEINVLFNKKNTLLEADDLRTFSKHERKQVYLYMVAFICGIALTICIFIFITLPKEVTYISAGYSIVIRGLQEQELWDSLKGAAIIFIVVYQYVLILALFIRNRLNTVIK